MSTKTKHIHKLKRHTFESGNKMFFCILPDCSYKVKPALSLGKRSICNRCGNEFLMNEYSIRLAKPHCSDCHLSKDGVAPITVNYIEREAVKDIASVVESMTLAERLTKLSKKPVVEEEEI